MQENYEMTQQKLNLLFYYKEKKKKKEAHEEQGKSSSLVQVTYNGLKHYICYVLICEE